MVARKTLKIEKPAGPEYVVIKGYGNENGNFVKFMRQGRVYDVHVRTFMSRDVEEAIRNTPREPIHA